jgi:hypothetical protein
VRRGTTPTSSCAVVSLNNSLNHSIHHVRRKRSPLAFSLTARRYSCKLSTSRHRGNAVDCSPPQLSNASARSPSRRGTCHGQCASTGCWNPQLPESATCMAVAVLRAWLPALQARVRGAHLPLAFDNTEAHRVAPALPRRRPQRALKPVHTRPTSASCPAGAATTQLPLVSLHSQRKTSVGVDAG